MHWLEVHSGDDDVELGTKWRASGMQSEKMECVLLHGGGGTQLGTYACFWCQ
jgi:hypothetical protein